MPQRTSGSTHYELIATNGTTVIPFMVRRPEASSGRDPAFPSIQELLTAAEQGSAVSDQVHVARYESWLGGVGISYNVAPGVYTRSDGYAMAAGAMTSVQVPAGTGSSNSSVIAFAEFADSLYAVQEGTALVGGRVLRSVGGTGTGAGIFANATGFPLAAGRYVRDLCIFDNGAGVTCLYASVSDVNGLNGELYRTSDGATWTGSGTVFGTNGRGRMKKVSWTTPDGVTGWRLVTISGQKNISYTIPTADPFLAASWVEGVPIETSYTLLDLDGARGHLFYSARDGLYDLTADGESPSLVSAAAMSTHGANGLAVLYQDGWAYQTRGDGGLHRIRVDRDGEIQEYPGVCPPGWGTRAESEWLGGYCTALIADQGCVVAAMYNPTTKRTGVFWGRDRSIVGIESPNPLIWWGPELTINADYQIKRMHTSFMTGDRRIWIAAQSVVGLTPVMAWASLPTAGAPIDDLLSGGPHRYHTHSGSGIFNPSCSLELLPDAAIDRANLSIVNETTYITRGLHAASGTKLTVYERAATDPSSTAWGTGTDVTTGATASVPATTLQGNLIQTRIDFINPSGSATPPRVGVLDAVRRTSWMIVPDARIKVLDIEYGDGVLMLENASWKNLGVSPDWVTDQIEMLVTHGRTTLRDPWDSRQTVKVLQSLDRVETITEQGDHQKHVAARLKIAVVDDL